MERPKLNIKFSDRELKVSEILLDLPHLCSRPPESYFQTSISNWSVKKRRTAIDQDDDEDDDSLKVKAPEVNSPSTPLSFALSPGAESDHWKSQRSCRRYVHRTKQEWLEFIDELTQVKEQLTKEVNNARAYYEKILIENSNLKARQKELNKSKVKNSEKRVVRIIVPKRHHNGPFRCPDLNMRADGPISNSVDQPCERNGSEEDNKDEEAAETRRKRMVKLKIGRSTRD